MDSTEYKDLLRRAHEARTARNILEALTVRPYFDLPTGHTGVVELPLGNPIREVIRSAVAKVEMEQLQGCSLEEMKEISLLHDKIECFRELINEMDDQHQICLSVDDELGTTLCLEGGDPLFAPIRALLWERLNEMRLKFEKL